MPIYEVSPHLPIVFIRLGAGDMDDPAYGRQGKGGRPDHLIANCRVSDVPPAVCMANAERIARLLNEDEARRRRPPE